MSDLKDLAFTVQQAVDAPSFDSLGRRATRRRTRRRLSIAAAVSAVVAAVLIIGTLPGGGARKVPIAPQPTVSNSDRDGEALIHDPGANVESFVASDSSHWAAAWSRCPNNECSSAAVLSSNGRKVITPVRPGPWATLLVGKEPIAVYGAHLPATVGDDDPTPGEALLLRFADRGAVQTPLRYTAPTRTFEEGELLTDKVMPGEIAVLNLKKSTLRRLDLPNSPDRMSGPQKPVRDDTGRWWFLGGRGPDRILWTDDHGKSWQHELLDAEHSGNWLAVSRNGRTIVATSSSITAGNVTLERLETTKVSTDAGATWRTVSGLPYTVDGKPAALDDGTVLLLGRQPNDVGASLYTISEGQVRTKGTAPQFLWGFASGSEPLYGIANSQPHGALTQVAHSADHGKTWDYLEPR
ncbi:hypothetical protein ACFTSF_40160 [Kribbella sp. NPDC056951]|uniref:hypothetical protein n=1 Tax=Kribbella sp. NPDC056951 TaxID=3345978 RepID=UPI0036445842